MDVTSAMRRAATFFANREAIVHGKDRLTFAAAWERGCRLANGLIALGLAPSDRVAVLEDNSKEAADSFLGAGIANLVRVPLYPRNSREAHLHMVGHTGCKALVVGGNYAHEVADFTQQLSDLRHILVRDQGYERWLAAQSPEDPMLRIRPEDNYIIRHTGGTTGRSKGVADTHKAWLACNPDQRWGETPCAIVVPKPGGQVDEADVIQLCIDQLGSDKKPGKVVVRDEPLPKTPVGKIKRRDLREPYWVGHPRRVAGSCM